MTKTILSLSFILHLPEILRTLTLSPTALLGSLSISVQTQLGDILLGQWQVGGKKVPSPAPTSSLPLFFLKPGHICDQNHFSAQSTCQKALPMVRGPRFISAWYPHPGPAALTSLVVWTQPGIPAPELRVPHALNTLSPGDAQLVPRLFGSFLQCLLLTAAFPGTPPKFANSSSLPSFSAWFFSLAFMTF